MPSIIEKLNRFGEIELSRMHDIGGLRIVVHTIDDIKKVHDRLLRKTSTLSLSNEKDYINTDGQKTDGYRSVHMIFKYKSKKHPELAQYNIEIQIRTQLQHCWGTTVETLGMIDKESYKTGKGEFKTKRFLLLVSALFALKEKTKIPDADALAKVSPLEIAKEIEDIDNELNITRKLQGVVVSIIEKKVNPDDYYYVLELTVKDDGKSNIKIMSFKVGTDSLAEDFYRFREQETQNLKNVSVLMIDQINLSILKANIQTTS